MSHKYCFLAQHAYLKTTHVYYSRLGSSWAAANNANSLTIIYNLKLDWKEIGRHK